MKVVYQHPVNILLATTMAMMLIVLPNLEVLDLWQLLHLTQKVFLIKNFCLYTWSTLAWS